MFLGSEVNLVDFFNVIFEIFLKLYQCCQYDLKTFAELKKKRTHVDNYHFRSSDFKPIDIFAENNFTIEINCLNATRCKIRQKRTLGWKLYYCSV